MSAAGVEGAVYRADGSAVVIVGQPAWLDLRLLQPNESGPLVYQDLVGTQRAFVQRIMSSGGAVLVEVAGAIDTDAISDHAQFRLPAADLAALLPSGAPAIDLVHVVLELLADGTETVVGPAPFAVRRSTTAGTRAVLTANRTGQVIVSQAGAAGLSAKQQAQLAGLIEPGATNEEFIAHLQAPATEAAAYANQQGDFARAQAELAAEVAPQRKAYPYANSVADSLGRVSAGADPVTGAWHVAELSMFGRAGPDRRARAFDHATRDLAGRVAQALDWRGFTLLRQLIPAKTERKAAPATSVVQDLAGNAAMAIRDGAVMVKRMVFAGSPDRRARPYAWSMGPEGKSALGLRHDGKLDADLSDTTLARSIVPTSVIRGAYRKLWAWRHSARLNGVLIQEPDGLATRARQRRDGRLGTCVAEHATDSTAPIVMLGVIGQSTSLASSGSIVNGTLSSILQAPLFPHHVLSPQGGYEIYADPPLFPSAIFSDLKPSADDQYGNSPRNALLFASEQYLRDADEASPGFLGWTVGKGGTPLNWFLKDAVTGGGRPDGFIYDSIVAAIDGAVTAARAYDREVEPVFLFLQGASGPAGREAYGAMLDGFFDDLAAETLTRTGRAAKFLVVQSNTQEDGLAVDNAGVALAQWDVAQARADTTLLGPAYYCDFHPDTPDTAGAEIHETNLARLEQGEVSALGWLTLRRAGAFTPLQPATATVPRAGAVVTITWSVPGSGLAWDVDRVPASAQGVKGFRAWRVAGGGEVAISDVVIAGATTVITLALDPGEPVTISYADRMTAQADHWSANRGQLYSPTGAVSAFARHGVAVRNPPRHYAIRCAVTTST